MSSSSTVGPILLNIAEAAEFLNVSKVTIRRWTNDGTLPCSRVGSRKERRFLKTDLQALIAEPQSITDESLAGVPNQGGAHRCVLLDESQQGWHSIAREVASHLTAGALVTFVGDAARLNQLTETLQSSDVDLEAYIKLGKFRMVSVEESYLMSGTFSGHRAAAFVESTILQAQAQGLDRTLFVGWSDWLRNETRIGNNDLIKEVLEYERLLDKVLLRYPLATVLCPYACTELDATTLVELVLHHPQLHIHSHVGSGVYGRADAHQ